MGKKRDGCSKKTERERKRAVLLNTRSFFILWVAAGLARPATAATAATATAAATFIDWIDLAAPPVTKQGRGKVLFLIGRNSCSDTQQIPKRWRHQHSEILSRHDMCVLDKTSDL